MTMEIRTRKYDGATWHEVYLSSEDPDGLYVACFRHNKLHATRFMKEWDARANLCRSDSND